MPKTASRHRPDPAAPRPRDRDDHQPARAPLQLGGAAPITIDAPINLIRRLAALGERPDGTTRVNTLGALLTRLPGDEVSVSACLHDLCDDLARRFDRKGAPSLGCTSDSDHLPIGTVVTAGLITDLLVSNAYVHGFAPTEGGRIAVAFFAKDAVFQLVIEDSSRLNRAAEGRRAYSLTIAALLARQLGGRIETPRVIGGSRTIVTLPRPRNDAPH